jgi:hypothetical protein
MRPPDMILGWVAVSGAHRLRQAVRAFRNRALSWTGAERRTSNAGDGNDVHRVRVSKRHVRWSILLVPVRLGGRIRREGA